MSIEIHVLFHGKLPSKAALTRCFKELGFPLRFAPGSGSLEQHKGYLPMRLRGEESSVEFDTYDGRDAVEEIAGKETDPRFTRSANLRLGGDENELTVAQCFAAALATLIDGVVFDPQEGFLQTVEQAIDQAKKQIAAEAPKSKVRGTRPADIKHYLKPLLQMRSDLVLVGRLLLIRPVRHLLRGAQLEPTSRKYRLAVRRYVLPLFAGWPPKMSGGDIIDQYAFDTWQPHFEPLLLDRLAEEIFGTVGQISTLADFATTSNRMMAEITALVLSGKVDEAADRIEQEDRAERAQGRLGAPRILKDHFERVVKDIDATCAECHGKEAELIKALKLEHVWEPTPFPVELPAAQRDDTTAEASFITSPWPARPPALWQEVPREPGEVRYAKDWLWRGEEVLLLVALTAAEAEERYRASEAYALATRLSDGTLVLAGQRTGYDRHRPPEPFRFSKSYHICLLSCSHEVSASVSLESPSPQLAEIESIDVRKRSSSYVSWSWGMEREGKIIRIHDLRSGEIAYSEWTMTPAERDLLTMPSIGFGEYATFPQRLHSLLRIAGYEELA